MFISNSDGRDKMAEVFARRVDSALSNTGLEVRELQRQIERLCLLNQAMWELLRERAKLTDADLERMAQEVDLRDGVPDGRITAVAVRCPTCKRVNNTRHKRCIYCSTEFDTMMFG